MKIPHILMANGDILLTLPSGPKYVTPFQFNYQQILRALPIDDTLLDELSVQPPTPNGIFYAYSYILQKQFTILVHNVRDTASCHYVLINSKFITILPNTELTLDRPLGVYVSLSDILLDFPEFIV